MDKRALFYCILLCFHLNRLCTGFGLPAPFSKPEYSMYCQSFSADDNSQRRSKVHHRHHHKHHHHKPRFGAVYNDTLFGDGSTADSESGVYDQMLRIDAMDLPYDTLEGSSYQLGQCTKPHGSQHIYTGEQHFTPYATTVPTFIKRTSSSSTSEFRDIMGGASVNVLGLFGASAKVQVTENIKRSGQTMLIISKFITKKGFVSLLNAQPNTANQNSFCKHAGRHYYVSDIMIGAEDYTFVELEFDSEQKRKEVEVKVKVKILFFSISKTIRDIKTESSSNLKVKVIRVSSYPKKHQVVCNVHSSSGNSNELDVVKLLEDIEEQRETMQREIKSASPETTQYHSEYFLTPCPVWNKNAKTQTDPLATELDLSRLLQQETELKNVLKTADTISDALKNEMKNTYRWDRFQTFKSDAQSVLARLQAKKKEYSGNPITQSMADELMGIYGNDYAPYHYKLKLNSYLIQECRG